MRTRTMYRVLLAALLSLAVVFQLSAREIEILLEDTELELPLEGALIRSWDGSQYSCDEDGKAVIEVPDDRQVVIQAAYPGYETGKLVIPVDVDQFTMGLRLSGIMENKELVVEAAKPGTSETKIGRSVALSGREIAQTAEIGVVEDVMNAIKLLPGVSYQGHFNTQPSIRGGDPGDMRASLDGFYIFRPFYWGGSVSIFDPRMVESAQLSHGVFSSRYGNTISGLLDITTKKPSPTETELSVGMGTSTANLSLSLPLFGKGGILLMGRVTTYDLPVALAKQLGKFIEPMQVANYIKRAPYIYSTIVTGNYRFRHNLELQTTGFWGMDGIGMDFENSSNDDGLKSDTDMVFNYTTYQGFLTTGLSWNPRNDMLLKLTAGAGYHGGIVDGTINSVLHEKYFSDTFKNNYNGLMSDYHSSFQNPYQYESKINMEESSSVFNAQGRIDYDWELGKGFLLSAGVQEMFNIFRLKQRQALDSEMPYIDLSEQEQAEIAASLPGEIDEDILRIMRVISPKKFALTAENKVFTTSAYALTEYQTPGGRFGAELGLRVDHFYLLNKDFAFQSQPALNPRLNLDFNVFKNRGFIESFDLSAGTGLFSSVNDLVAMADKQYGFEIIKPNRSWTSVLGTKLAFIEGLNLNIEGYYKQIFDRFYMPVVEGLDGFEPQPRNNGEGQVWGVDLMLQKVQSRYWDGWISYSYNWARYREPDATVGSTDIVDSSNWHFPDFHRFHNLNVVLNIKPTQRINIYTRLGLASGVQLMQRLGGAPVSYPVYVYDEDSKTGQFIEKYYWPEVRNEHVRTTPSAQMDVKLSIYSENRQKKTRSEWYVAIENLLALAYTAQGNTNFNQLTGEVETGSMSASYDLPIPIPSFGFKFSY